MRAARLPARHAPLPRRRDRRGGLTLVEITVVLMILALIGLGVLHRTESAETELKLDAAASELSAALRFARAEALRTGEARRVKVHVANQQVTVGKPDLTASPPTTEYVLTHPLDKHPYDFIVGKLPGAENVLLGDAKFYYVGIGSPKSTVIFDAQGLPFSMKAGTRHPLASGSVSLDFRGRQHGLSVSRLGRITTQ